MSNDTVQEQLDLDVTSLVVGLLTGFLAIGVVAGWLAARRVRGGLGLAGSIGVGILGAYAGGFLFGLAPLNLEAGLIGALPRGTGFVTPSRMFRDPGPPCAYRGGTRTFRTGRMPRPAGRWMAFEVPQGAPHFQ